MGSGRGVTGAERTIGVVVRPCEGRGQHGGE